MTSLEQEKSLKKKCRQLHKTITALRFSLGSNWIPDAENAALERLIALHETKLSEEQLHLDCIRTELKKASVERSKKRQPKKLNEVKLSYRSRRKQQIKETHKISGFGRRVSLVQGGAPGLGKKK
jgi:fructose-1,6-bisphosphatase